MAFVPNNHELGTLELSKKLDIHKSTVSRLLHLLTAQGFLHQNSETKKYLLGRSVAELGNAVIRSLDTAIVNIARPYMNDLCETVGESVALEVLSGTHVILAGHVEGRGHIRFSFQLGEQVPIHVAAGAKAILANCDPDFVKQCIKKKFNRFNENTIVSKRRYYQVLDEVRREGVAYDKGERYEDSYAVATPIFNYEGLPVAALVIAGPAFRMTADFIQQAVPTLKKTAADISERLFY